MGIYGKTKYDIIIIIFAKQKKPKQNNKKGMGLSLDLSGLTDMVLLSRHFPSDEDEEPAADESFQVPGRC